MTNAPEGRTYMKKKWVLDPDIKSGKKPRSNPLYYTGADEIIEETPFVVSNGKYVLERPNGWDYCKLVGADHKEVEDILLDDLYTVRHTLYVCDRPFGFVTASEIKYGPDGPHPAGEQRIYVAQKVHKGELLPGVETPKLELARQMPDLTRKMHSFTRGRDQKRNHVRWARLTDVIEASGLSAQEVVLGYWPFIGRSYDSAQDRSGTLLHIIVAGSPESIRYSPHPRILFLDKEDARELISGSLEQVWIRSGLAKAILHMQALGVQPEVSHTA